MREYEPENVRNIALIGHGGTGKTSLSEAMLFLAGAISRLGRVDEGTTTSDYDPDEVRRKISINLSLVPYEWKGHKINVIDTPGYADFVGEVKCGLRAADAAVIVVDAAAGVQVGTEYAWSFANEADKPRIIVINRMDRENADFYSTLSQLQSGFGAKCLPLHLPIGSQANFSGVVDLMRMKSYSGEKAVEGAVPEDMAQDAAAYREKLVETIAETDDTLIDKYLEGEEITDDELRQGLCNGIRSGSIVPVLAASAATLIGVLPAMDALVDYLPSPKDIEAVKATEATTRSEVELAADPSGPMAALVFKTTADPYVGRLTYFRVYSGTLSGDSQVWNANKEKQERVGQLFLIHGKTQEPIPRVKAGDIGAVAKLADTATGDTLSSRERPLVLPSIVFPEPSYRAAIYPKTKADLDKMSSAMTRIAEEDPSLKIHREQDTNEVILSGLGESHVEVAVEKMRRKFGVDIELTTPKVPYKETVTATASAEYIHKKQTGGHGQYARVAIRVEPLPRGTGFQFADQIVGGVVPKQYIPSVEKGVAEALREGILAHYPLIDLKVTLYDGKEHPVDSSDIAFKIAGAQALKKGAQQAKPVLLEPIVNLRVTVPDAFTGDVISDLNGKRARVLGMTPSDGVTVIEAQAPLAEVQRYSTDLRSITQGRGSYTWEFSHYEEAPLHVAQRVIEQAAKEVKA